jgi:hypothetical protein
MNIPAIGATCLGIVIGWLIRYFLFRFENFNPKVLGSTISLIAGGVVISFLQSNTPDKTVVWFYPIGVLGGFIIYTISARLSGAPSKGSIFYSTNEKDKPSDID